MWLTRVQALSGLAFALFLGLHLATTASAVGGPARYDATLATLRSVYRPHLVVEVGLIGTSGAVHVACAARQLVRRRRARAAGSAAWRTRIHRWAGYVLLAALGGHVFATRVVPALSTEPGPPRGADFAWLAYSVLGWPEFIDPYYVAFGLAGAVHLMLGIGFAISVLAPRAARAAGVRRLSVAGAVVAGALVTAGVGGIIARADRADRSRFPVYGQLYDRYLPYFAAMRRASN